MFDRAQQQKITELLQVKDTKNLNKPNDLFKSLIKQQSNVFIDAAKREEAKRSAVETKLKLEMEASAKKIADAAAKQAAESATKAAAMVLAEESLAREKVQLEHHKKEIEELKATIKKQELALQAQKQALDAQSLAAQYVEIAQQNQRLIELINALSNPMDLILLSAAQSGDCKKAEAAITLGANVNTHNEELNTPLHLASSSNHVAIVKLLLINGANKSLKNLKQKTAISLTTNPEILKFLNPNYDIKNLVTNTSSSFFAGNQLPQNIKTQGQRPSSSISNKNTSK